MYAGGFSGAGGAYHRNRLHSGKSAWKSSSGHEKLHFGYVSVTSRLHEARLEEQQRP